jgi:hypothetical protein
MRSIGEAAACGGLDAHAEASSTAAAAGIANRCMPFNLNVYSAFLIRPLALP